MITFNRVLRPSEQDPVAPGSIVRLPNVVMGEPDDGKIIRNRMVTITNATTGERTLRRAMGAGNLSGVCASTIVLDYDARRCLGVQQGDHHEITVRHATQWEQLTYFWSHHDPAIAMATKLAVLSVGLGLISLCLGALPFLF